MIKKILTIIMFCVLCLTTMGANVIANTGTGVEQEKIKKEEEKTKEKEKEKPKTVYTDEDLKKIKKESVTITEVAEDPDANADAGKTATTKPPDPKATAASAVDPKQTEKYWRDRVKVLKKNIKSNQEVIKKEEEKLAQLHGQYYRQDMGPRPQQLWGQIQDTLNSIKNYQRGIKNLEKQLEELEEEARREGALPGWLIVDDDD